MRKNDKLKDKAVPADGFATEKAFRKWLDRPDPESDPAHWLHYLPSSSPTLMPIV